jgi:pimeloyl-ACP methyl ester carboxylesterase
VKRLRAAGLAAVALLAGCASPGGVVVPPAHDAARSPAPRVDPDGILLLYAHGSRQEYLRDRCFPNSVTTPRWLRRFAGSEIAGLPVSVHAVCTPSRTGEFDHRDRSGEPKVVKRTRDLEAEIRRFVAQGFAPGRIVLLGHSAGGWAALLAAHDGEPPVAGVIAFAPAFAGPLRIRSPGWQWLRDVQARWLADSEQLPALVYAYRGDRFETPEALAFLKPIPGLLMITLDPAECGDIEAHRAAFNACVMDGREQDRIAGFIERRVQAGR